MGGPTIYHAGETVTCPGTRTDRRRSYARGLAGDRRAEDRPCRHRWGRVAAETVVTVRLHATGRGEPTMILECPDCRMAIDLVVAADPGQAETRQTRRHEAA